MIKIQNENIWDVNFSLNSKMVKNFNKTFNTKKIEKIENMFFKMFPNNYNDYKTNLININNDDKSISFNLNALMNLIEESLNDVIDDSSIPNINPSLISNINSVNFVNQSISEGIFQNKSIFIREIKGYVIKDNILFNDHELYFRIYNQSFPRIIGKTYIKTNSLVIEKVNGKSLLYLLENQSMLNSFENYKLIIIIKIIQAVEDIHSIRKLLVYLHPRNIYISNNFEVFFTGIYESDNELSVYSSPKILLDNDTTNLDVSCDIWSLGCIFYFIFTGLHPYNDSIEKAKKDIKSKILFMNDSQSNLSSKARDLIKICCNLVNDKKINSVGSLKIYQIITNKSFYQLGFKALLHKKEEKNINILEEIYKPALKTIFSYLKYEEISSIHKKMLNKKVFKILNDVKERYKQIRMKKCYTITESKPIYSLSHSIEKDKDILIVASADSNIKLYNITNGKIINKLASEHAATLLLKYTRDNIEYLLCYCKDKSFKVFNYKMRELEKVLNIIDANISSLIHINNQIVAYASEKNIYFFNLDEGKTVSTLVGHFNTVKCLTYLNNYDNNLIASGSWDSTVKIWDIGKATCINTFYSHKGSVVTILHLYDYSKELLASSSTRESNIKIWNFVNLQVIINLTGHSGPILNLFYLNQLHSSLIVSTANEENNSIKIWDLEKRECVKTLSCHESTIKNIIFSRNSKGFFNLISSSEDYIIKVWELEEIFIET